MKTWKNVGCSANKLTLGFATFFNAYDPMVSGKSDEISSIGTHNYNQVCRLYWKSDSDAAKGHTCDVDSTKAKFYKISANPN